jgi:hypothetical protein
MIRNDENEELQNVEENDDDGSPDSDSGDESGADDDSSDQTEEGDSESDSNDVVEADESTSADSDEKEPKAEGESSDQNEEGISGSDGNGVGDADESTSSESDEEEPNPPPGFGEQMNQEEDEEPETETRDDSLYEKATEDAGDTNSSPESEGDKSQSSPINLSHMREVLNLEAKIAELENTIAEKDQHIKKLEAKNAELQRIIKEFQEQQIPSDDYVDSIEDFESARKLSNSSIC